MSREGSGSSGSIGTPDASDPLVAPDRWLDERRIQMIVAGVAVASFLAVLAVTRVTRGGGGTDAVCYCGIADNIVAGNGLGFWLEDPLVTWPPLWPLLLAGIIKVTSLRADVAAVFANAVFTGTTVILVAAVARRILRRPTTRVIAVVGFGLGATLVGLASFIQTEPIFNVVVLGAVVCCLNYDDERHRGWLIGAVVLTWVGFLSRYAGLYLVPILGAWLLAPRPADGSFFDPRRWRWLPALGYAVAASIVPVAWMARNVAVSDTTLGPRYASGVGVARNTLEALTGVSSYLFVVRDTPEKPTALIVVVILAVIAALAVAVGLRSGRGPVLGRITGFVASPLGLLTWLGAAFTAILIISRSRYGFDNLNIRLMAPSLIAFGLVSLAVIEKGLLDGRAFTSPVAVVRGRWAGIAAVVGWTSVQVALMVALIGPLNGIVGDFGFNADRAREVAESPVLDEIPAECRTYSNNAFDLYRSGFRAYMSPRRVQYQSIETTDELPRFVERVENGELICLAWVDYTDDDTFWTFEDIAAEVDLVEIGTDGELRVYRAVPLGSADG